MLARPDVVVLLTERDGEPAGYVSAVRRLHLWLGRGILGLDDLFVREGYRGAGVGHLLMTELAALRFYRRLGAELRTTVVRLLATVTAGVMRSTGAPSGRRPPLTARLGP